MTVCAALAAFCVSGVAAPGAIGVHGPAGWVTAWEAAMEPAPIPSSPLRDFAIPAPDLHDQTVRIFAVATAAGDRVRVRLSNTFGHTPLRISRASIAGARAGAGPEVILAERPRLLRFNGAHGVVIPAGAQRFSDPVDLRVRAGEILAVNLYAQGDIAPTTWNEDVRWHNLISTAGDYVADSSFPVSSQTDASLWLSGIEVWQPHPKSVVVAFGDSITDGFHSSFNTASSYPDDLARRLRASTGCRVAVANAGISGNMLSRAYAAYGRGPSMQQRFQRDVVDQAGARYVILLGGINDIAAATVSAEKHHEVPDVRRITATLIGADEDIIGQAHAAHLKIFGGTIIPFRGAEAYSATGEQVREAVNHWIRHDAPFDGVVDFDAALRDPEHLSQWQPALHSGDYVHPNDAGYQRMADAVDLSLFGCNDARVAPQSHTRRAGSGGDSVAAVSPVPAGPSEASGRRVVLVRAG